MSIFHYEILYFTYSASIQSCKFPEISREFQDLTILYRLLGTESSNIESTEEEPSTEPEEIILPTFTITYNGNGNDGGDPPQDTTEYSNGQFITILGNTGKLILTGNSFISWNTASDGSGTNYNPSDVFRYFHIKYTLPKLSLIPGFAPYSRSS